MSANHNQGFDHAVAIIRAAKACGADAVKLQTYTADTMTIQSDAPEFRMTGGTLWDGTTLYDLYKTASMPWEWQPKLKKIAGEIGIDLFSTPFDKSAVDFLAGMDMPAYKVASYELIDTPLIEYIARKGKPIIMATGMANRSEIREAIKTAQDSGNSQIVLLKCTSAYPAPPEEMNLRAIPEMAKVFKMPVGLSDHTLGISVSLAAVALGACVIEKHFTISRQDPGPDSAFSMEPAEFKAMAEGVRTVEKALGEAHHKRSDKEIKMLIYRRSLFVVKDMKAGEIFTEENARVIRPGNGLGPRYLKEILGRQAARDIKRGTPLRRELIS
jgi:pseudaminic acid synthase